MKENQGKFQKKNRWLWLNLYCLQSSLLQEWKPQKPYSLVSFKRKAGCCNKESKRHFP